MACACQSQYTIYVCCVLSYGVCMLITIYVCCVLSYGVCMSITTHVCCVLSYGACMSITMHVCCVLSYGVCMLITTHVCCVLSYGACMLITTHVCCVLNYGVCMLITMCVSSGDIRLLIESMQHDCIFYLSTPRCVAEIQTAHEMRQLAMKKTAIIQRIIQSNNDSVITSHKHRNSRHTNTERFYQFAFVCWLQEALRRIQLLSSLIEAERNLCFHQS